MTLAATPLPFNQKKRISVLWTVCIAIIAVIILAQPGVADGSYNHEILESTGLALIIAAVMGRLWSILYIGAKKNEELIMSGPYSMTRNPLYFFSILGMTGAGLIFGSFLLTATILAVAITLFRYTAQKEAAFLHGKFGAQYELYAQRTPLILPAPALYTSGPEVTLSTRALAKTFRDCLPFLVLYPLIELVELLHTSGIIKPLFYLP